MQAIIFDHVGGPDVMHLAERPMPTAGPGEVIVRNRFAGVNYIDTYFRSGLYAASQLPATLGNEASGVVSQVGPGVTDLQVGDHVAYLATQDAYAQYARATASRVAKLSPHLPLETAAAVLLQGLTAHALATRAYPVQRGDWVLVHAGAGGTGRLLIQIACYLGAHVIATVSTEEKAQVARAAGAHHVILYTKEDVADAVHTIVPEGVHAVFDGVGKATFEGSLNALRMEGSMVSFGNSSGAVPPVPLFDLSQKNLRLLRPRLYGYLAKEEDHHRHIAEVFRLVEEKIIDVKIFNIYDLADAPKAHADLEGRKTTGKLLLRIE
ncbi:NADPH:quinone reductase [Coemansia furcata]|nr:NADPH:quinone reductase [Coemansia furcata]